MSTFNALNLQKDGRAYRGIVHWLTSQQVSLQYLLSPREKLPKLFDGQAHPFGEKEEIDRSSTHAYFFSTNGKFHISVVIFLRSFAFHKVDRCQATKDTLALQSNTEQQPSSLGREFEIRQVFAMNAYQAIFRG